MDSFFKAQPNFLDRVNNESDKEAFINRLEILLTEDSKESSQETIKEIAKTLEIEPRKPNVGNADDETDSEPVN